MNDWTRRDAWLWVIRCLLVAWAGVCLLAVVVHTERIAMECKGPEHE